MARLLLFSALALAGVAAGPGAASRATLPRCAPAHLEVSVRTQGLATTAWMGLTVRNPRAACSLRGTAVFTIEQNHRVAAVAGNPLKIPVAGRIGRGHSRIVKAAWSNWCHSRRNLALVAHYAGKTERTPFHGLPACIDRKRPSRLAPID